MAAGVGPPPGDVSCLFCRIAAKEIPAEIVYEDAHTVAFLDREPRTPGHTIIISRVHSVTIVDLPEHEIAPLFLAVRHVAEMLEKNCQAHGLTIGVNHGRVSGQAVDHLHVHLLPRFEGDGGGSIHSVVHVSSLSTLADMGMKIRGESV